MTRTEHAEAIRTAAMKRAMDVAEGEGVPRYFDIACRRIEDAQRQGDLIRDVLEARA